MPLLVTNALYRDKNPFDGRQFGGRRPGLYGQVILQILQIGKAFATKR
jgi:hypothetical protein